jgi:hypothetical protein
MPLPRITNARGKRILAKGVIVLHVQLGTTVHRVRFYVAPGLAVPCILGCKFIYLHFKAILQNEKRVDINDGDSVAIEHEPESTTLIPRGEPLPQASTKVRTAQRSVIPPRCEAHVTAQIDASELCLIQNRIRAGPGQGLSLANGVAEVRPHVTFKVRMINTSHRERVLPKGMILGAALPHPTQVISIAGDAAEHADNQRKTPRPSEGEVDASKETPTLADQVNMGHLNEDEKGAVLRMLEPHKKMWDGHLCTVTATQHRIQLTQGAQPVHAQPYRAGARARGRTRRDSKDVSTRCHRAGHV